MSPSEIFPLTAIRGLGFTTVEDFQEAWALGAPLKPDGINGPLTNAAARLSMGRRASKLPDLSAHFAAAEFRCTCGGKFKDCRRIRVRRELIESLEKYRTLVGGPVEIASAYRCPGRNREVGGVGDSQHLYGAAADLKRPRLGLASLRTRGWFAGLGYVASSGLVSHVDRRDISEHNPTSGTLTRPTVWVYQR